MAESLAEAEQKLAHVQKMIADGEAAYSARKLELTQDLRDTEAKLQHTKGELGQYERVMVDVRADDQKRKRDLDRREKMLAGRERALSNRERDLDAEKQRFYQTRDLQE